MSHSSGTAQQPQAINLKIQNPINLRLTNQQVNLLQQHNVKPGLSLLQQRPVLINKSQLRPVQPKSSRPAVIQAAAAATASGSHVQAGSGQQLLQPASVALLQPRTRIATNPIPQNLQVNLLSASCFFSCAARWLRE